MHGRKRVLFLVVVLVAVLMGCGSLDGVMSDAFGAALERPTEEFLGQMMAGWTDAMAFQMAYLQVFLLGGYGAGLEQFAEGEGVTWEVVSSDDRDSSTFIAERALLRNNADGTSWWYLAYRTEDNGDEVEMEYEARLNQEYHALEIYFRDPETGEIRHQVLDQPEAATEDDEDWDDLEYDDDHVVWDEELGELRRERVRVTVGAGTFDAELLVYDFTDEETGERGEYRWWTTSEVPGELVLYEWEGVTEAGTVRGELMQVRRDYRTRFGAY
ncbi:MAG: hypothetical protein EA404_15830 [Spirochaetaceae bacterium]|nr:MAG: hypothetical protein EA404_15830 [Spirochaetaceae bacterium]